MSNIEKWSTTAASNNDPAPDGFPEAMLRTAVNDSARELMAAIRKWYDDPEWLDLMDAYTVTREDADTIRIADVDATSYFPTDRRIKVTGGGDTEGGVTSSETSGSDTLVHVNLDGGASVPVGTDTIYAYINKSLQTQVTPYDYIMASVFG